MIRFNWILFFFFFSRSLQQDQIVDVPRSFDIDYENNIFLKDGKEFTYASGEIHYFRIPRIYWEDRLEKVKLAGLNAISVYVEWSLHEPSPGVYHFKDEANVIEFINLAQKKGLLVILRPGPYICAERDFGGYPSWLLTVNPKMQFRTSDPSHTFFVARWLKYLMNKVQPLLYGNGGPIIMVQVENEYGSYPVYDVKYLIWLRDLYRSYIGNSAVLFTTDGPGTNFVTRGKIPGVFSTIDFGPTGNEVLKLFNPLRKIQPKGPLVNSEFYVGWITYWGEKFSTADTDAIVITMKEMIANNISFNCYMFHGGTNFGLTSGSGSSDYFQADITSYDYDAPISEAGDLTSKYFAIKEALAEKYPSESVPEEMKSSKKGDYGVVMLEPVISLLKSSGIEPIYSRYPLTMEELGQRYGFIAYTTVIPKNTKDPSVLQVNVRDRALVLINGVEISVLQYTVINETPLPSDIRPGMNLTILVENMGRRNYKLLSDCTKGMISNATLDGQILQDWTITGYPLTFENASKLKESKELSDRDKVLPAFFSGVFQIPENEKPLDTFLDMSDWGKGVVFINNHNLGRYWHVGPQKTLYVPKHLLMEFPNQNKIIILELHYVAETKSVKFTTEPNFNLKKRERQTSKNEGEVSAGPPTPKESTETEELPEEIISVEPATKREPEELVKEEGETQPSDNNEKNQEAISENMLKLAKNTPNTNDNMNKDK